MNNRMIAEVVHELERLPISLQSLVLDFIRRLATSVQPGVPGKQLLHFAGTIPSNDLEVMSQAIEQGCEQVDLNEW